MVACEPYELHDYHEVFIPAADSGEAEASTPRQQAEDGDEAEPLQPGMERLINISIKSEILIIFHFNNN